MSSKNTSYEKKPKKPKIICKKSYYSKKGKKNQINKMKTTKKGFKKNHELVTEIF